MSHTPFAGPRWILMTGLVGAAGMREAIPGEIKTEPSPTGAEPENGVAGERAQRGAEDRPPMTCEVVQVAH